MNNLVKGFAWIGATGLSGMGALVALAVVLPLAGGIPAVLAGVVVFVAALLLTSELI